MSAVAFENSVTERFRRRMVPHIEAVYRELWGPGCRRRELRGRDGGPHPLDRDLGIDAIVYIPSADTCLTVQEKIRENTLLRDCTRQVMPGIPDFTQNHTAGFGTSFERPGEWQRLGAQLFLYAWATAGEDGIEAWLLLDVARYKLKIAAAGGLGRVGVMRRNERYSKTAFYCIPVTLLSDCIIASSGLPCLADPFDDL